VIALSLLSTTAFAVESSLVGGDRPVQTFAPDGTFAQALSIATMTTDMSNRVLYSVYSGSGTCFLRTMPTAAKGAYVKVAMPNTTWVTLAKNPATPFVNLSGCVAGYLQAQ